MQATMSATVTLQLSAVEADWLKQQMQNPLHGQNPMEETPEDREMRKELWTALSYPKS